MTKQEIINKLAEDSNMSKKEIAKVIGGAFDIITNDLIAGNLVTIKGFGKFLVRDTAEKKGRNPRTGEDIVIPAHKTVVFKPFATLKETINKG